MMRIRADSLAEMSVRIYEQAYERGAGVGRQETEQRVRESTQALLAENNKLKMEISSIESRLRAKDQKESFPAVRAEQIRIAKGILYYTLISPEQRRSLLESLILADLAQEVA